MLAAPWVLDDTATEQLMNRFYEHLYDEESAGESPHRAMKWMRNNGLTDIYKRAPLVLIGGKVTVDLTKKG